jgi:electron transfer flavoprotein alpha subunit
LSTELRNRAIYLAPGADNDRREIEELAKKLEARAGAGKVESVEAEEWIRRFRAIGIAPGGVTR